MALQVKLSSIARTPIAFCFPLDEISEGEAFATTRYSALGGYSLGDNGTATSAAGKMYPYAAKFTRANSEYLSMTGNAIVRGAAAGWWRAGWIYLDTLPGAKQVICGTFSANTGYDIHLNSTPALAVTAGTGAASATDTHGTTLSVSTWYFWYVQYDGANLKCSVNAGSLTAGTALASFSPGSAAFRYGTLPAAADYFNGRQQMGLGGDGQLTQEQIDTLYQGGVGLAWPSAGDLPQTSLDLSDSSIYGIEWESGIGMAEVRRLWTPRWKYGYDSLNGASPGNRRVEMGLYVRGTSVDNWVANATALSTLLADAERYQETIGSFGRPAILTVQLANQTNPAIFDVLGGELVTDQLFQHTMTNTAPVYRRATLRLQLRPFSRPRGVVTTASALLTNGGGTAGGNQAGAFLMASPTGKEDAPALVRQRIRTALGAGPYVIIARKARGNPANFIWCFECESGTFTGYTVGISQDNVTSANAADAGAHAGNIHRISNVANTAGSLQISWTLTENREDFFGAYAVFYYQRANTGVRPGSYELTVGNVSSGLITKTAALSGNTLLYLGVMTLPQWGLGPGIDVSNPSWTLTIGGTWSGTGATTVDADCIYLFPIDEEGYFFGKPGTAPSADDRVTLNDLLLRPFTGLQAGSQTVRGASITDLARTPMRVVPGRQNLWMGLELGQTVTNGNEYGLDLTKTLQLQVDYYPLHRDLQ